jgi:hypothetical protein
MALRDPVFEVRVQVALGLAQLQDEAEVTLPRDEIFDVALHELTAGRATWKKKEEAVHDEETQAPASTDDELHRGLAHVFTVLGLCLEREPLNIAYRALRAEDRTLRGTAQEYLEVVVPPRVRDVLVPLLGDVKPARTSRLERGPRELADELLRSAASLARPGK